MDENELSNAVIGASIEVHRHLGPGLLEAIYRECLAYELQSKQIKVECEVPLPVCYKGLEFSAGYRADLLAGNKLIVELKAVDTVLPVHTAQLLSYLRLSGMKLGLLINFNVPHLRSGIKRVVNQL